MRQHILNYVFRNFMGEEFVTEILLKPSPPPGLGTRRPFLYFIFLLECFKEFDHSPGTLIHISLQPHV